MSKKSASAQRLLEIALTQIPHRCCYCSAARCKDCRKRDQWEWIGGKIQTAIPKTAKLKISKQQVIELYLAGKTEAEIAKELGCAVSTISGRLRRSGIDTRSSRDYPVTDAQRQARRINLSGGSQPTETSIARQRATCRARYADNELGLKEYRSWNGYIRCYFPEHPAAAADGCVAKHRLVMERALGRLLEPDEVVHHINHVRDDNRLENLQIMTREAHCTMHGAEGASGRMKKSRRKSCETSAAL